MLLRPLLSLAAALVLVLASADARAYARALQPATALRACASLSPGTSDEIAWLSTECIKENQRAAQNCASSDCIPYKNIDPDGRQSRDLEYEYKQSGATSPPGSPDDWLGPAIGGALIVAALPVIAIASIEVGIAVLSNPASIATATEVAAGAAGVTGVGVTSNAGRVAGVADDVIADSAVACRGGGCTAERFASGTGVTVNNSGQLQGVSVNVGQTLEAASAGIPNGQVGTTTVGQIRAAGGQVVASPTARNSNHATMSGLTPKKAEELFTPTVDNPNKRN